MNKYEKNYEKFDKYMDKIINEDKLSHAFLIECRNVDNYKQSILEKIKKILEKNKVEDIDIARLVDNDNYPELKIINPINNVIKKEQLLELQEEFNKKPIYGKYMIYIIDGAEYFNKSSANTLLKFLEDPPENIIAFLLTNNLYNVIDTISSRCQKIILDGNIIKSFSDNVEQFAENLEKYKENAFGNINIEIYSMDKEQINNFLKELKSYYISKFNLENSSKEQIINISKKITIIDDSLKKLRYNVNIKLFIDQFLLSISEVI